MCQFVEWHIRITGGRDRLKILLNRAAPVSLRDQVRAQLEVGILTGSLSPGERLPSVRALATRLGLHRNTVLGAYHDLVAAGNVTMRRGAGIRVRSDRPENASLARAVSCLKDGLEAAVAHGLTRRQVREAFFRLSEEERPHSILVVDPSPEMGRVYAVEIARATSMHVRAVVPEVLRCNPPLVQGTVVLALPHHLRMVRELVPWNVVHPFRLAVPPVVRREVEALRDGGLVVVASESCQLLEFSVAILWAEAPAGVVIKGALANKGSNWRRVCAGADVVLADAVTATRLDGTVGKLVEMPLLDPACLAEIGGAICFLTGS